MRGEAIIATNHYHQLATAALSIIYSSAGASTVEGN
jgi:hypothetical protein